MVKLQKETREKGNDNSEEFDEEIFEEKNSVRLGGDISFNQANLQGRHESQVENNIQEK